MTIARKGLIAAVGALALGFTLALPSTGAKAAPLGGPVLDIGLDGDQTLMEMQRRGGAFRGGGGGRPAFRGGGGGARFVGRGGGGGRGFRGGRGGIGPAGIIGLGAAAVILGGAAAAASAPRECWIERRWVDGPYGPERRSVRICE